MTARDLTKARGGVWCGTYGLVPGPGHSPKDRSLKVWQDGDQILVHSFAGDDWRDCRAHLGLVGGGYAGPRTPNLRSRAPCATAVDRGGEAKATFARRIWSESRPAAGTPVENYLKSRGLTIEPPPTLRYHLGLKHGPTGLFLPAMVAAVARWPGRDVVAIHRTFLVADGRKKAPVSQNKMMLGRYSGGAVRLAEHGAELVLAEGIETALSVLQATGKPAWACLSTSGLKVVILPPEVTTITIAADGDAAGEKAALEAARRFYLEGREVKIARPPARMDWNDVLQLPENVTPLWRRQEVANG
jgi:hypothetical protein